MQQKWRTVRPWLPPPPCPDDDPSSSKLRLEVLDVTATAVALSVFTPAADPLDSSLPSPSTSNGADSTPRRSKPPLISIQLDRRPWPHVAHAGSLSTDTLTPGGNRGAETTVIVYGLEPGLDYEISLDVVGGDDGDEQTIVEIETTLDGSRHSEDLEAATPDLPRDFSPSPASQHTMSPLPDGPPPPYSPAVSPTSPPGVPDESQLRALLKKIRTSSKRTETVLNASISALKKSVEKSVKEDQRARTRIVSLEEAIRKAKDGEREMRTREREACEKRIAELARLEEEVALELVKRKEAKLKGDSPTTSIAPVVAIPPPPPPPSIVAEEEGGEEEEGHEVGIADLAKELDTLNKRIEEAEMEQRSQATETLHSLEMELSQIESNLNQLDRDEAHRYNIAARLSSDSIDRIDAFRQQQPIPPPTSHSTFALKWGRRANQQPQPQPPQAPHQPDPRSFGRFFRRNPTETSVLPSSSSEAAPFHPLQYAQEKQQQALWGAHGGSSSSGSNTSGSSSSSSALAFASSLRRRSGSLNSVAAPHDLEGGQQFLPRVMSMPMTDAEEPREVVAQQQQTKPAKEAGSWGRAWSQVVIRSKVPSPTAAFEA